MQASSPPYSLDALSLIKKKIKLIVCSFIVVCVVFLSGCAQLKSHNELMTPVISARNANNFKTAAKILRESTSNSKHNHLLYALELGELLRENKEYKASTDIWLLANEEIDIWEQTARKSPQKLLAYLGASTVSERLKPYEPQDYEKTWLTTRIALNHMALGNWDAARVSIMRTHQREAIIAQFREKEMIRVREQAQNNGWKIRTNQLGAYPVKYIESPDVLELDNSYQNAFSHYLAGFIYESLNEPSLSAPGYRKAIELKPGIPLLEEGLKRMEARINYSNNPKANKTDVLFVIETGDAPARIPFNTDIPIFFTKNGQLRTISVSLAFPYIKPTTSPRKGSVQIGEKKLISFPIVNMNAMARRALHDEMPGLIFRGMTRAASKGALQYYAQDEENPLVGLLTTIFSVATELADDRIWRTLPGTVLLARGYIRPGEYPLIVNSQETTKSINIHGRYALVPIRISGGLISVGRVATYGELQAQ